VSPPLQPPAPRQEGLEATAELSEGQIVAGKYRIEKVLGRGGMGVVVAARHVELEERVAIKFLLPEMLGDEATVARFYREAKSAARIKSEHVARVFDVGRLRDGAPYMVLEFLDGVDLSAWLANHGALPIGQAVDFVVQACIAVADAHALGIVHRDLKPANLFCVRRSDGQISIKVLDFGISKLLEAPGAGVSLTQTSSMMGSPLYMSPEQFRSAKNVDTRTDIWALGAILYELVTAKPPFSATTVTELAIKIAIEPLPSPTLFTPSLPRGLVDVITTCLEKEPEQRFRDVAALAQALMPFAPPGTRAGIERVASILHGQNAHSEAPRAAAPPSNQAGVRTATGVHWTSPELPRRKSALSRFAIGGALALLGGLLVAGWKLSGGAALAPAGPELAAHVMSATPAVPLPSPATTSLPAASVAATAEARVPTPEASAASVPAAPPAAPSAARKATAVRTKSPAAPKAVARSEKSPPAAVAPAVTPPPEPPTRARVSCDPPFYFDAAGNRIFKQECL